MGKPFWLIDNLFTAAGATVRARTEQGGYPAVNLQRESLYPPWRSGDSALVFNGIDEYAHVADHADFDSSGSFSIECLIRPENTAAGTRRILHKLGASSGFALHQAGAELVCTLNGTVTVTTTTGPLAARWDRFKLVYDSTLPSVRLWRNGVLIAAAHNASVEGCLLSGVIPGSIAANDLRLSISANDTGSELFAGRIGFIALAAAADDDSGWLAPSACRGYWSCDQLPLDDASGRGHTLTAVGLDAGNTAPCTAAQWLCLELAQPASPDILFVDRRHNLSDGAKLTLWRGTPEGSPVLLAEGMATAGQALALTFTTSAATAFTLVIDDPGNAAGFLEVPYLALAMRRTMSRSFLRGYTEERFAEGVMRPDGVGGAVIYPRSKPLNRLAIRFRLLPGERDILDDVGARLLTGAPVVFAADGDDPARAWLMRPENPLRHSFTHIIGSSAFADLDLTEIGT